MADNELPSEISPEALAELEKNLSDFKDTQGSTVSGSSAVGTDLDQYEIPPEILHLYKEPRGQIEQTEQGSRWVTAEKQYMIFSGVYAGEPLKQKANGQFMRLDDMINFIVNGPEGIVSIPNHGWRLGAILPGIGGSGVAIMERNVKRVLPDPVPVKTSTEVVEVQDEELRRMNETAQKWAEDSAQ